MIWCPSGRHHRWPMRRRNFLIQLFSKLKNYFNHPSARFCCMAWCSANRKPTRWVALMKRAAQFSAQAISPLSSVLLRNDDTQPSKHRSTRLLYILKNQLKAMERSKLGRENRGKAGARRRHLWQRRNHVRQGIFELHILQMLHEFLLLMRR